MIKILHKEENNKRAITYSRSSIMYDGGWYSYENNVVEGDVRIINEILSRAWIVRRDLFRKNRVHWISINPKCLREVDINEKP